MAERIITWITFVRSSTDRFPIPLTGFSLPLIMAVSLHFSRKFPQQLRVLTKWNKAGKRHIWSVSNSHILLLLNGTFVLFFTLHHTALVDIHIFFSLASRAYGCNMLKYNHEWCLHSCFCFNLLWALTHLIKDNVLPVSVQMCPSLVSIILWWDF